MQNHHLGHIPKLSGKAAFPVPKTAIAAAVLLALGSGVSRNAYTQQRSDSSGASMDEVLVSAEKRTERLQDVPVPVTVLDAGTLAERNQNTLQDYLATVPGLNLVPAGSGTQTLVIRGIATSASSNPTVAVMVDDVPYGSSTIMGAGQSLYPDIDPSDLKRVEVLRGPQGTLYGASSLGGLIKFVTKDPSTEGVTGRVQVVGNNVEQGEFGYGVRGAVNIPLSETVAVRASGFARRDPGYIDNVMTGEKDVNRVDVYGGRLAGIWRPSSDFSIKLSALLQNTQGDGTTAIDASNAQLQPVYFSLDQARLRGTENYSAHVRLFTATVNAKFDGFELTSNTGYNTNTYEVLQDINALGFLMVPLFDVDGAGTGNNYQTKKFSQELRLSSTGDGHLQWLAGLFYTHESTVADQPLYGIDPATGERKGLAIDFYFPSTLSEYSVFGDLTYKFSDSFDVQVGGRESWNRQVYNETDFGPLTEDFFGGPSPFVNPTERTNGNAFTYLFTPRFRISKDLMAYARLTSGYRVGSLNANAFADNTPAEYSPDKTNNYEVGFKGDFLDHRLSLDASAYYIKWKDLQITLRDRNGFTYRANAGDAKSQGVELAVQARPAQGLTIGASTAIGDAKLTQDLPPVSQAYGKSGAHLPLSSRFSGTLTVDQDVRLTDRWTAFAGGSVTYIGERDGEFMRNATQTRLKFPGYADTDVHLGARDDSWTVNLFVNNVTDRRGVAGGGPSNSNSPYYVIFIPPRIAGLSVTKTFP